MKHQSEAYISQRKKKDASTASWTVVTNSPSDIYQYSLQNSLCKKKKIASLTYSICLLTSFNFLNFIMLLFRPIYLSFCMGFSFWGGGGVDQHDSSYPEGRPTVVWIKSYGYRLVGQEYQHTPKVYWEGIFIAYKYSYVLLCSNRYFGWLV